MVQLQGLTIGELIELYDNSSDEAKQWMSDNIGVFTTIRSLYYIVPVFI